MPLSLRTELNVLLAWRNLLKVNLILTFRHFLRFVLLNRVLVEFLPRQLLFQIDLETLLAVL